MKKAIAVMIVLVWILSLFVGCANSEVPTNAGESNPLVERPTTAQPYSPPPVTEFSDTVDGFSFDLTPEELLALLESKGIDLKWPNYEEYRNDPDFPSPMIEDGRDYNATSDDYTFSTTNGMHFTYHSNGELYSYRTSATAEGLRIGDSIETMEQIYGTNYIKDNRGYQDYLYYNGSVYLHIFYQDGLVTTWELSLYDDPNYD